MNKLTALFLLCSHGLIAQDLKIKRNQSGIFSLGVRSTISAFNDNDFGTLGHGYGGQFRIQFGNRLNTEWYADYMRGNTQQLVNRTDYHIGWSVMYYFTDKAAPPVKPYIIAGHCFDRTEMYDNRDKSNSIVRGSSAIQAGAGVHFNLSPRFDITVTSQYMFHLGGDVHAHIHHDEVEFSSAAASGGERTQGTGIEGHVLFNVGLNYKIADLWGGRKKG